MNKLTQTELDTLLKIYMDARERLLDTIINFEGVGTKVYANTILIQLERNLKKLQKETDQFIQVAIPREYRDGLAATYRYFRKNKLQMKHPSAFATIHTDQLYQITREMQHQITSGLAEVGRQVLRYVDSAKDEALRQAGLYQTGVKVASGGTVQDMRNALLRQLQADGFMTVQYGSGIKSKQVPVDVYASTVARSTTREAANTARTTQMVECGFDLVKISEHYPTCKLCAMYQGRVYSISGNDPRFPTLSSIMGQYRNIHPNCRHVLSPWIEELKDEKEIQAAIARSNAPYDDPRSAKEQMEYKSQQDKNRTYRQDLYQFERYKAVLGEDAPKNYGAFRRLKYSKNSEKWDDLQHDYRQVNKQLKQG